MLRTLGLAVILPALAATQNFDGIRIEKVIDGQVFAEGPVWSRDGYLLWSDVPNNRIHKWIPGHKSTVFREQSGAAAGNTIDTKGNLYTCESRARRVTRTDKKSVVEVLAEKWEGKRLNAPNDIVVRRDGHVYFTDPAYGNQSETRELDFYGIYHIPLKGPLELVAKPMGRPDGVAISPNGKILYVSNADDRAIYAYDLDGKGTASNERKLIAGIVGVPGGIRLDEKGNLYVTAEGLAIYSPGGKLEHTIEMPETPHNCAFGDLDFQTLFITARTSVYRVRLDVKGSLQY